MTGIVKPPKFGTQPPSCPTCGQATTSVTEERVTRRLCDPKIETREPGSRWRRYEPCGHVIGIGVSESDPVPEFGPMSDLAPIIERINADVRLLATVTETRPTLVDLLTSDEALAASREAWELADAEGAKGDRVRRGMVAAIKAVS